MSFNLGGNVGPYRIMEQLGQGGMATVYKAYHAAFNLSFAYWDAGQPRKSSETLATAANLAEVTNTQFFTNAEISLSSDRRGFRRRLCISA